MATTTHEQPARERTVGNAPMYVVLAGTLVTFLDFFIVNVALPSIERDLGATSSMLSLVVAGYALTFAVGMIPGGRLGDLYGRRRMFAVGIALFTVTSAACGLAPTAELLVVARFLQGAAGAIMTPQVLAILGTVYTGSRRAKAFAAYGFAMGIAGVLGQLLGGALIQADIGGLGWRTIFLINVPVGLVTLAAVGRVPESHGTRARLDLTGVALVTATVSAVVLPLVEGPEHDWPLWTWLCLATSPILAGLLVRHLRTRAARDASPLVDPGLFANRTFTLGLVVTLGFTLVPPAFFFALALYLQQGRGLTALESGTVFVAVGAGYFGALLLANAVAARIGSQVLALGAGAVAVGCVLLVDTAHSPVLATLPGLALVGLGIGFVLVPLASTVLADTAAEHAGAASGVLSTVQQVGGALGIAVVSITMFGEGAVVDGFTLSLWVLAGIAALTVASSQVLARR
ncbi:MFS transporter [Solicola gregarius]|uniref:MFS transporter n=1 Tax=Solicola gregarius TaxID=2908642 RepID=A0AA46YMZ5_9ACTN|nr:MFS transporter [Solicola gregarius]UYM06223.1 MFS transporter [Solicola gregarius]